MAGNKNRKSRSLILLLIALIVLIGACLWLIKYNDAKDKTADPDTNTDTSIASVDADSLQSIYFKNDRNEMTLKVLEDGTWEYTTDEAFPLNQTYVTSMKDALSDISSTRTITENTDDLSQFGLDTPSLIVIATLTDGSTTTIALGDKAPVANGYYATLNNGSEVYILPDTFFNKFDYNLNDMITVETIPSITADNITHLTVENRDSINLEVKYEEGSPYDLSGLNNYIMLQPYATPVVADSDAVKTLFGNYSGITFSSCADYNATDLSKYGLDNPSSTVSLDYYEEFTQDQDDSDAGQDTDTTTTPDTTNTDSTETEPIKTKIDYSLELLIGNTNENGDYYAKLKDSTAVNIISASTVEKLTQVDSYSNVYKYINLVNIDKVKDIQINVDGKTYTLGITSQTEKVDGKDTTTSTYYFNGKEADETKFKDLYQVIIGTTTEREIPQDYFTESVAENPYMTVTYHLTTSDEPVVVSYIPYDDSYDVVDTNGIQYFLTDLRKVKDLAASLADFTPEAAN